MVSEVQGVPGELIDRFIAIVDDTPSQEPEWWAHIGDMSVAYLGGHPLSRVVPDTGRDFVPGTLGAQRAAQSELVSKERFIELLKARLFELVNGGMSEDFLIRALVEALNRWLESLADIGATAARRAEIRADLERRASDPAEWAAFRDAVASYDPSAADWSDGEVVARLQQMAESSLVQEPEAEEAVDRWTHKRIWDERRDSYLSEETIDTWSRLRAIRGLKG